MKLKFSIHYSTAWGEGLYVAITYHSDGQRSRNYLLPMVTDDGEVWTLETSVMESRQRPVTSFSYHYQVMDTEGHLLRKEWDKVPRLFAFDSSRDYYAAASADNRQKLADDITNQERELLLLQQRIKSIEKTIRNTENIFLTKNK